MSRIFSMIVVMTFLASPLLYASHHKGKCEYSAEQQEKHLEKKMKKMTKTLSLNDNQQGEVEALLRDKMSKKRTAKQKMTSEMEVIRGDFKAKMRGVLEPEQEAKFEEMISKYEGKKHKKRKRFFLF